MLHLVRCECECSHAPDLVTRRAQLEGKPLEGRGDLKGAAGCYLWLRAVINSVGRSCMIRNPLFRRFEIKDNPLYQGKRNMPAAPSRSEPADVRSSGLGLCGFGSAPSSPRSGTKKQRSKSPKPKSKSKSPPPKKPPKVKTPKPPKAAKAPKKPRSCWPFFSSSAKKPKKPKQQKKKAAAAPPVKAPKPDSDSSRGSSKASSRESSRPPSRAPSPGRPTSPSPARSEASSVGSVKDKKQKNPEKKAIVQLPECKKPLPKPTPAKKKAATKKKKGGGGGGGGWSFFPFFVCRKPPAAKKSKMKRGLSEERKNELNKAAEKHKEQWIQQREAKEEAKRANEIRKQEEQKKKSEKAKKGKLTREQREKVELQKRQEKPISFLDCSICNKILRFAVEIDCGHAFCEACLRKRMRRSKLCPVCMSEIEYVHPSYVLRELVEKFGSKDGPKRLKADLLQASSYYEEEDPILIACQFSSSGGSCCSGTRGAFDPADLYKSTRLEEYVSEEDYLDTIKMVNQILSSWASSAFANCLGTICCCLFPSPVRRIVSMIEIVLGDCNLKWPETGLFWTLMRLDGDAKSAGSMNHFYLILRIDPMKARGYQNTLRAGAQKKDVEIARLRKQNALMTHKMLELGENTFIRALAGRRSSKYSLKTRASLSFVEEYPDSPVISAVTLRDFVLHNPLSKRYFIPPWNRLRSTSTGPLPLTSQEDYQMKSQLSSFISRSPSPYLERRSRSPPQARRSPHRGGDKGVSSKRRHKSRSPYEKPKKQRKRKRPPRPNFYY